MLDLGGAICFRRGLLHPFPGLLPATEVLEAFGGESRTSLAVLGLADVLLAGYFFALGAQLRLVHSGAADLFAMYAEHEPEGRPHDGRPDANPDTISQQHRRGVGAAGLSMNTYYPGSKIVSDWCAVHPEVTESVRARSYYSS